MHPVFQLLLSTLFVLCACQPSVRPTSTPAESESSLIELLKPGYPMVSAHRGGRRYDGYPENCIQTFEYVLSHTPAIIECDVEMTADSVLVLMHDNTIDRTTTGRGLVSQHTYDELAELFLVDDYGTVTTYKIPSLMQTLRWAKQTGAVLTVDMKPGVPIEMVTSEIGATGTQTNAAIITYSVDAARRVYSLDSMIVISAGIRTPEALQRHLDAGIPARNILAFTGISEPAPDLYETLHSAGISAIIGAMGNLDNKAIALGDTLYHQLIRRGADCIATDRPIEAAAAISELVPQEGRRHQYWMRVQSSFDK